MFKETKTTALAAELSKVLAQESGLSHFNTRATSTETAAKTRPTKSICFGVQLDATRFPLLIRKSA